MKSWLSFFLPNDEYKEKKMLYFMSEGAIILFFSLIVMIVCNKYFNLEVETVLLLGNCYLPFLCIRKVYNIGY